MGISFPRIQSPLPARPIEVVNLPFGVAIAAECHGRVDWGGHCHQPLGKSSKPMAWSPRTMLLGTSGGVLGRGWGALLFLPTPRPAVLGTQGPWNWCPELLGDSGSQESTMLHCPSLSSKWTPNLSGYDSQRNGYFQGVAKTRTRGAKHPFSWEAGRCSERKDCRREGLEMWEWGGGRDGRGVCGGLWV